MGNIPKKILRKMGYIRDQRGLANRYMQEHEHWQEHLTHTKNFILRCVEQCSENSVTILGSGWWLDIPVDDLLEKFRPVRLVDIYQPPEIKKRAEKYPDIQLVEADVTGGMVMEIFQAIHLRRKHPPELSEIAMQDFNPGFDPGYIISLNLLSQIDSILLEYWTSYVQEDEKKILAFREKIQQKHIDFLRQHPSCLITDTLEIKTFEKGKVITKPAVVVPVPETKINAHWFWTFDTLRTYDPDAATVLEVKAACFS